MDVLGWSTIAQRDFGKVDAAYGGRSWGLGS